MRDMAILGREREGGSEISEGKKRKSESVTERVISQIHSQLECSQNRKGKLSSITADSGVQ